MYTGLLSVVGAAVVAVIEMSELAVGCCMQPAVVLAEAAVELTAGCAAEAAVEVVAAAVAVVVVVVVVVMVALE